VDGWDLLAWTFRLGIVKFYMRCLKRAEKEFEGHDQEVIDKRKSAFDKLWKRVDGHYTRQECPSYCPCNEFAALEIRPNCWKKRKISKTVRFLKLTHAGRISEFQESNPSGICGWENR
jgi:hypothetical protein